MPVAYACSSDSDLESLVDSARRASAGESFVVLLDDKESVVDRLMPAYLNAYVRHGEKRMRAGSLQMELMLFLAGTFMISDAISEYGAKDIKDFILASSSDELARRYARKNRIVLRKRCRLRFGPEYMPPIE